MSVYIVNPLQILKEYLTLISPKQSINATTEGNATDTIYIGELVIDTVSTYHCATHSVWPGQLLIALYLAPNAESLGTPALHAKMIYYCIG